MDGSDRDTPDPTDMKTPASTSIPRTLARLEYLPDRTPGMAFSGGTGKAFAELSKYREGAIYVGFYSGSSEWERHPVGDEIVMALEGSTTLVFLLDGKEERVRLETGELVVVPVNTWHRFEGSRELKVMSVTPLPTDHRLERPDD